MPIKTRRPLQPIQNNMIRTTLTFALGLLFAVPYLLWFCTKSVHQLGITALSAFTDLINRNGNDGATCRLDPGQVGAATELPPNTAALVTGRRWTKSAGWAPA